MKYLTVTLMAITIAITLVLFSSESASAQTRKRVVVFLVRGNQDCCTQKAKTLIDWFKSQNSANIEFAFAGLDARNIQNPKDYADYTIPWNSLYNRHEHGNDISENVSAGTDNFIEEVSEYISTLPEGTALVFVGHSFGGDSILSFL